MLPASPPRYDSWADMAAPIRRGDSGWPAYAVQAALFAAGYKLILDGDFGPATESAARGYQASRGLIVDGIVGASTQRAHLNDIGRAVHERLADVPDGLMRGYAEGEGANMLAATNWSVAGGVDCGAMQIRCYTPYQQDAMKLAFDPLRAMTQTAKALLTRADEFYLLPWVARQGARRLEWALRCAVLAHNWPAGASSFARYGYVPSPDMVATWVPSGTKFPDGTAVSTRREWAQFYALGGPHGEGAIVKYVTAW